MFQSPSPPHSCKQNQWRYAVAVSLFLFGEIIADFSQTVITTKLKGTCPLSVGQATRFMFY